MSIYDSFSNMLGGYGVPIYLGSQILSTALRGKANQRVLDTQRAKADAERARQATFGAQARGVFDNEAMANFTPEAAEARRVAEQTKEEALAKTTMAPPQGGGVLANYNAQTGNAASQDSISTRLSEAMGKAGKYATTGAKMRSYGSGINVGNILLGESGQKIARIGSDASRSSAMLPGELDWANLKGRDMRTGSDLIGGAGAIAGLYALTRPKKAPAAPNRTYTYGGTGGGDMSADWPAGL